eukprot:403359735
MSELVQLPQTKARPSRDKRRISTTSQLQSFLMTGSSNTQNLNSSVMSLTKMNINVQPSGNNNSKNTFLNSRTQVKNDKYQNSYNNFNERKPSLITGGVKRMEINRRLSLFSWNLNRSQLGEYSDKKCEHLVDQRSVNQYSIVNLLPLQDVQNQEADSLRLQSQALIQSQNSKHQRTTALNKNQMTLNQFQKENLRRLTDTQLQNYSVPATNNQSQVQSTVITNRNRRTSKRSSRPLSQYQIALESSSQQQKVRDRELEQDYSKAQERFDQVQSMKKPISRTKQNQAVKHLMLEKLKSLNSQNQGLLVSGLQFQPAHNTNHKQSTTKKHFKKRVLMQSNQTQCNMNNEELQQNGLYKEVNNLISHLPDQLQYSEFKIHDNESLRILQNRNEEEAIARNVSFKIKVQMSTKKENIQLAEFCSAGKQSGKGESEFSLNKNAVNSNKKGKEFSPLRTQFKTDNEPSPIKRWLKQGKIQSNFE